MPSKLVILNKIIKDLLGELNQALIDDFRMQLRTLIDNLSHVYRNGTLPGEIVKRRSIKVNRKRSKQHSTNITNLIGPATEEGRVLTSSSSKLAKENVSASEHAKGPSLTSTEIAIEEKSIATTDVIGPTIPCTEVAKETASTGEHPMVSTAHSTMAVKRRKTSKTPTSSPKKTAPSTKKRRPIMNINNYSNTTEDAIIGKLVAYNRNSSNAQQIIKDVGKLWDPSAICYQLDPTIGHIVGTVMRPVKGSSKRKWAVTTMM